MKRLVRFSVGFTVFLMAVAFLLPRYCGPRPGDVIETWQTSNQSFQVQIVARNEKYGFLGGGYYTFRSMPFGSEDWVEIMTFRHDDPVAIPKDQVHFVNDQIAFGFMGWMYAVTTDGGKSWSVWDARKDLLNWKCCNYGLIEQVNVHPEGQGTMIISVIDRGRGEVPLLQTKDYGRHWAKAE